MKSLKDFIDSNAITEDNQIIPRISTQIGNVLNEASITNTELKEFIGIGNRKKIKFQEQAIELATSDEVLKELSDKIGQPREEESEDEFVERSKNIFAEILKEKLET